MATDAPTGPEKPRIAVLGAGVVGLTVAAILALRLRDRATITVIGESTPSEPERDKNYTSPKAGANWVSLGGVLYLCFRHSFLTFHRFIISIPSRLTTNSTSKSGTAPPFPSCTAYSPSNPQKPT